MTIPNKVLVVNQFNTAGAALAVGDLVVLDGEKGTVISAVDAVTTKKIQFGVVKREAVVTGNPATSIPPYIVKTKAFTRDELLKFSEIASAPAVEDEYTLTLTGLKAATASTPLALLHVNLTYDLDGANVKREESYVLRIADFAADANIAAKVAELITGNGESWATATALVDVVTITAKTAIDNQPGSKSIVSPFSYNQTKMKVHSYSKDNESALSAYSTTGIAIAHTAIATPGVNNPYVIRDQERAAAGYDSAHFSHVYPNQAPVTGLAVTVGGLIDDTVVYDAVTFAADLKYRAADTNYVKTTTVYNSIYGDTRTFLTEDVIAVLDGTYTGL